MKKTSLLSVVAALGIGVLISDSGIAQTAPPPTTAPATATAGLEKARIAKINKRVERLKTELNLTADQETKVRDLIQANVDAAKAHREANPTATAKEHRKALAANRTKLNQDVRALLTPEQQAKFDALQAKHQNRKAMKHEKSEASPAAPATAPTTGQ